MLAEFGPHDGRVLAGGQSLVPIMAFRMARPAHLVDINEVAGLDRLAVEGDKLSIGAVRAPRGVSSSGDRLDRSARCSRKVVRHIAHYPIRMRGTFCGSLAHADPASEWCLIAATLGADDGREERARRARHRGERFFRRHDDDGAGRGRVAARSASAGACPTTPASASMSSAAAPAISRSRWRW